MQPHEVDMDLVLMAEHEIQKVCANTFSIDNETECDCPTDDQIRTIIAAVYSEIWAVGYTTGFADKTELGARPAHSGSCDLAHAPCAACLERAK